MSSCQDAGWDRTYNNYRAESMHWEWADLKKSLVELGEAIQIN